MVEFIYKFRFLVLIFRFLVLSFRFIGFLRFIVILRFFFLNKFILNKIKVIFVDYYEVLNMYIFFFLKF